jgi:mycothiol system anti-sigma-R factor
MDCKKVEQAIFRFLYGESDAYELKHIKTHLDLCGDCKRESEIIGEILSQLKNCMTDDPVPDGLRERILEKIQAGADQP